jgi:hypothetical protein
VDIVPTSDYHVSLIQHGNLPSGGTSFNDNVPRMWMFVGLLGGRICRLRKKGVVGIRWNAHPRVDISSQGLRMSPARKQFLNQRWCYTVLELRWQFVTTWGNELRRIMITVWQQLDEDQGLKESCAVSLFVDR